MNMTFNFNRFAKVLSNEWVLNWKKVASLWGSIFAITTIIFALQFYLGNGLISRASVLAIPIFIGIIIQVFYLQYYFNEFSSKKKTQALLLLPASRNETFWAKFILGVVLYTIIAFCFTLALLEISKIMNVWLWENGVSEIRPAHYLALRQDLGLENTNAQLAFVFLFLLWMFSVSAFLLGILIFKKNAVLKSFIFWAAVIVAFGYFICIAYFLFTGHFPSFAFLGVIWFDNRNSVALFNMYPNLLFGAAIFINIALIAIARVKYNEKTI